MSPRWHITKRSVVMDLAPLAAFALEKQGTALTRLGDTIDWHVVEGVGRISIAAHSWAQEITDPAEVAAVRSHLDTETEPATKRTT